MKTKAIVLFVSILVGYVFFVIYKRYHDHDIYKMQMERYHIKDYKYNINSLYKDSTQLKLNTQRIPKIIHQTYINKDMDIEYYETCMINKNMNFEYDYKFYTDHDVRKYISNYFPEYLKAYDKIIPGAYRADLFRYLVLYKEGGVYMDCKSSTIFPLRDFINPDIGFVSFKDRYDGTIQISFIASIPGHSLLKKCIEMTISNIMNERYGINMLDITGPQICGRALNILLKRPELYDIEEKIFKEIDTEIIGAFYTVGKNKYEVLCDKKLKPLISRTCGSYFTKGFFNKNDYRIRWQTRTVYN